MCPESLGFSVSCRSYKRWLLGGERAHLFFMYILGNKRRGLWNGTVCWRTKEPRLDVIVTVLDWGGATSSVRRSNSCVSLGDANNRRKGLDGLCKKVFTTKE